MTHLKSTLYKKLPEVALDTIAVVIRIIFLRRAVFCSCVVVFFFACKAEYETVVQKQVVTEVVQNSKGTYRIKSRPITGSKALRRTKIAPGDTLQCMVLRRIR